MDLARLITRRIRDALDSGAGTNIAVSSNTNRSGRSTTVYSDDNVTIIERDGHREVIRHDHHDHRDG